MLGAIRARVRSSLCLGRAPQRERALVHLQRPLAQLLLEVRDGVVCCQELRSQGCDLRTQRRCSTRRTTAQPHEHPPAHPATKLLSHTRQRPPASFQTPWCLPCVPRCHRPLGTLRGGKAKRGEEGRRTFGALRECAHLRHCLFRRCVLRLHLPRYRPRRRAR